MNKFESQLRSVELRKTPKSLDERMDALFTEASSTNSERSKRFISTVIAIAASIAIVAGIFFATLSNPTLKEDSTCASHASLIKPSRIIVASLGSDISQAFGVGAPESKSFFASEKSEIRRLHFVRSQ